MIKEGSREWDIYVLKSKINNYKYQLMWSSEREKLKDAIEKWEIELAKLESPS